MDDFSYKIQQAVLQQLGFLGKFFVSFEGIVLVKGVEGETKGFVGFGP